MPAEFVDLMQSKPFKSDLEEGALEEFWQSDEWVLEPDVNGRRCQCLITEKGIEFTGRTKDYRKLDISRRANHIVRQLEKLELPTNTLFDGFLLGQNNYAYTVQLIELSDIQSIALQEQQGNLNYVIHDVIYRNNEEVSYFAYKERREILEKLIVPKKNIWLSTVIKDQKKEQYEKLKDEYDNFTFKMVEAPYIFGKSAYWRSLKRIRNYFAVIMSINEGQGRFEKMCGSLTVGQYREGKLVELVNIGGAMDFDDRIEFFDKKETYLGKVVEIKTTGRSEESFYDARFYRLRFDKKPEDCVFEE
jgi:ATP-dependent DNA ligase